MRTLTADRLFAERGYSATTVRDIAEAAGVTERTFFRYFTGKEELIIDDALGWLPVLLGKLRGRPDGEDVGTALRRAIQDVGTLLSALLAADPAVAVLGRATRHPDVPDADRHPAEN